MFPNVDTALAEIANTTIKSITIPNSVITIGAGAFMNCSNLTNIDYIGTIDEWQSITFNDVWDSGTGSYTIHCKDGNLSKIRQ